MKATIRNSRNGNADHNDRNYDIEHDSHIDKTRVKENIYWNIYGEDMSFQEAEKRYYQEHYKSWTEQQNKKYIQARMPDYQRTVSDLLLNQRYVPEETWLQIGNKEHTVDNYTFEICVRDYIDALNKFSENIHVLDWAIHYDETTPHAHIRKVYDYTDKDGNLHISQSKALEALGFEVKHEEKASGRYNNPKMAFDEHMRNIWYDICESHGVTIDRSVSDSHDHMTKPEYINHDINQELEDHSIEQINQQMKEYYKKEAIMKEKALKLAQSEQRRHGYSSAKKLLMELGYPELKHSLKDERQRDH